MNYKIGDVVFVPCIVKSTGTFVYSGEQVLDLVALREESTDIDSNRVSTKFSCFADEVTQFNKIASK